MITSVKLGNFLSHKDTELTFDNGVTVFIGDNGAGKSSVIDAMTFALFGKTTRGNNEETIRDGENQAVTQIHFEVNGKTYHAIKKTQGKTSSHQLLDGNSSPIAITADKTEEEIKKIIGMDYETLGIASIVPQGELSQIIQSKNGRKLRDLIDKVIGTGKYSAAGDVLSDGITAFRGDLREKYDNTDEDVDKIQREINDANQIISKSKPEKEELEKIEKTISSLEKKRRIKGIRLMPSIESALGVVNCYEIASSSKRIDALVFGIFDLLNDMGIEYTKRNPRGAKYSRYKVPVAATAAGVAAIDGIWQDLKDKNGFTKDCQVGRSLGYAGKSVIHPDQIQTVHKIFHPSKPEIEWAKKVCNIYEKSTKKGIGAIVIEGKMIDEVHYKRAKALLEI